MKSRVQSRVMLSLLSLVAVLLVAACTPNASARIISPDLGEQLVAEQAGDVVAFEPTPIPKLASLTDEQKLAGLPADLAAALTAASPEKGVSLATAQGCIGCHQLDPNNQVVAPTWHNIGDMAVGRVAGVSPAEYLHQSIINPGAYIVANYQGGIMPATFSEKLSTQDLADIIAYLLTLNGQP